MKAKIKGITMMKPERGKEVLLYAEGLDAGYDKKAIVCGLNLKLHRGEIITLIGPNGTGKSTILKTLSGQISPVRGRVFLKGHELAAMSEKEISRTISLLITERVGPELMTCFEVVSIGRYPYTGIMGCLSNHDRDIIDEAMRLTNVEDLRDRLFSKISDGQKQRVLLAKAVCQEPEVLILDEPTSFLDIRHKLELLQVLLKLVKEQNVAVIISLHEIELAERISDRVICVKDGKAEEGQSTRETFSPGYISRLFDISESQYRWLYSRE